MTSNTATSATLSSVPHVNMAPTSMAKKKKGKKHRGGKKKNNKKNSKAKKQKEAHNGQIEEPILSTMDNSSLIQEKESAMQLSLPKKKNSPTRSHYQISEETLELLALLSSLSTENDTVVSADDEEDSRGEEGCGIMISPGDGLVYDFGAREIINTNIFEEVIESSIDTLEQ